MEASPRLKRLCLLLRFKSTQLFIVAGSVLLSVLITLLCIGFTIRYEVEHEVANLSDVDYWRDRVSPQQQLWYDKGIEELTRAMRAYTPHSRPRSVHLLLVSGVDGRALAAARFQGSNTSSAQHSSFVWDRFPHTARLKNSCSSSSPCDAANVFKAFWAGVPLSCSNSYASTSNSNYNCSRRQTELRSVLRQAQIAGMRTGFVTNQRITGPTAAALYAHVAQTSWECDGLMPVGAIAAGCEDVAGQLISGETGQALNVILGGGRQMLSAKVPTYEWDATDELLCRARAGRNLLRDWQKQKLKLQPAARFELVQQAEDLKSLNASNLDYLLGVLANGDLSGNRRAPTLQLMLNKTLQVLRRPRSAGRHLLIVEHQVKPQADAIAQLQLLNATLSRLLGQPDVLTLVMLHNGNYLSSSRDVSEEAELVSTLQETFEGDEWQLHLRLQQMPSESLLFAQGPKSLLFYGVHEETYLAQALAYALGLNDFKGELR
ncbi:hypothetical protein KR222_010910 [Zaprionus bogoriensis]|nr:hypothetical protein KR222_010910 [Zaprionus bogoriensis]